MNRHGYPIIIKIFVLTGVLLQKLSDLSRACFAGFWLGVLKRENVDLTNMFAYDKMDMYRQDEYNRSGLFRWEERAINKYFQRCKLLLVAGAGGGREVLALSRSGYDADGFECNPDLVERANELIKKEGINSNIQLIPPDQCLDSTKIYDGIIVGWGVYMHIQGRRQRVAFLKRLRSQTREQTPILLSFYFRSESPLYFRVVAAIGNIIRLVLRRDCLEIGDTFLYISDFNQYIHCFTKKEIDSELREGGFQLEFYGTDEYGHAVGIASKPGGETGT